MSSGVNNFFFLNPKKTNKNRTLLAGFQEEIIEQGHCWLVVSRRRSLNKDTVGWFPEGDNCTGTLLAGRHRHIA